MSFVFDTIQHAISKLEGDAAIKYRLRSTIDALHTYSHDNEDAPNYHRVTRKSAVSLAKAIKAANNTDYQYISVVANKGTEESETQE